MDSLKSQFPNLSEMLREMTSAYKGGFKSDNGNHLVYMMPVFTFGHHTGDNYFELDKRDNGFILSIVSRNGSKEVVRTPSQRISKDLSSEEWDNFIDSLLREHIVKPEYPEFAAGKVGKAMERKLTGRGCLVSFIFLGFIVILLLL
jgi:hypothetical protein